MKSLLRPPLRQENADKYPKYFYLFCELFRRLLANGAILTRVDELVRNRETNPVPALIAA